jgi:hypothetical protein
VRIGIRRNGRDVRLEVDDAVLGERAELRERVFERFAPKAVGTKDDRTTVGCVGLRHAGSPHEDGRRVQWLAPS